MKRPTWFLNELCTFFLVTKIRRIPVFLFISVLRWSLNRPVFWTISQSVVQWQPNFFLTKLRTQHFPSFSDPYASSCRTVDGWISRPSATQYPTHNFSKESLRSSSLVYRKRRGSMASCHGEPYRAKASNVPCSSIGCGRRFYVLSLHSVSSLASF